MPAPCSAPMNPPLAHAADPLPARRLGRGAALWLNAAILVMFFAVSAAPSPLYATYREAWGFSPLMLTLVFGIYALTLLVALLVFGALSDHLGRRDVLMAALVLEIGSVLLFWHAQGLAWLFWARALQGVATGIAAAALSAGLLDLDRERGSLVNSLAPLVGMTIGALGTGVLMQFAPAPTRLVFALLFAVLVVQAVLAWWLPDTVSRTPGAWRSLVPSLAIPPAARAMLWRVFPVNVAQWALGGFYLSLGPMLARHVTGSEAPTTGGLIIAALMISGAGAIGVLRQRDPRQVLLLGAGALAVGIALTLAGVAAHASGALFAGTVVAGLGFGAAFNGSVRSLVPLAQAHERAGLMSTFFVLSYVAFSLPAIGAGLALGRFGMQATAMAYGGVLVALSLLALAAMARRGAAAG